MQDVASVEACAGNGARQRGEFEKAHALEGSTNAGAMLGADRPPCYSTGTTGRGRCLAVMCIHCPRFAFHDGSLSGIMSDERSSDK